MGNQVSGGDSSVRRLVWLIAALLLLCARAASAQVAPGPTQTLGTITKTEGLYKLDIEDNSKGKLSRATADKIQELFFQVYPQECTTFNSSCERAVLISVVPDTMACGEDQAGKTIMALACNRGTLIEVSAQQLLDSPQDLDMITHEAMHTVQMGYNAAGCGHWVEGIADVARARFGKYNAAQGWQLQYDARLTYLDGYGATAHFLEWIKSQYVSDVAVNLDSTLRTAGCPDDTFWQAQSKLGLDALWNEYLKVFDPTKATAATSTTPPGDGTVPPTGDGTVPATGDGTGPGDTGEGTGDTGDTGEGGDTGDDEGDTGDTDEGGNGGDSSEGDWGEGEDPGTGGGEDPWEPEARSQARMRDHGV